MNKLKIGDRIAMIDIDGSIKKGWLAAEYEHFYSATIERDSPYGNANIICIPKNKIKPLVRL